MTKRVLIITTAFAPENEIGSIRISKLVKYMVRSGLNVTVISPELHEHSKVDKELEESDFNEIIRIQIAQSNFFRKIFLSRRNSLLKKGSANSFLKVSPQDSKIQSLKSFLFGIVHYIYTFIRNYDWKRKVISYIKTDYDRDYFDIVFSSYPSIGAHWAARFVLNHNYAKMWIADFRDPINYTLNTNKLKYFINTRIQKSLVKEASLVTYISKDLLAKFPFEYQYKFQLLVNGFDHEDSRHFIKTVQKAGVKKLQLCYVGSLYGGERRLNILFKALNELSYEKRLDPANIQFFYAGKEFNIIKQQSLESDCFDCLVNMGFLTRKESLNLQLNSDVVVVATWNTNNDKGILTGKLYEAFLTRRTILGIVNGTVPNSEFKHVVDEVNGGFVIEESSYSYGADFQHLKDFIATLYEKKMATGAVEANYNEKLDYYTYKSITDRLVGFLG